MKSILNLDTTKYGTCINIIHDLQIDSIVKYTMQDASKVKNVLSMLENIVLDKETIYYRQGVLKDLMYNRTLYITLLKECASLEKCYAEYDGNISYRSKIKMKSDISISDISTSLRDYAYTFKKLFEVYMRLDLLFKENNVSSNGLKIYANGIRKVVKNEGTLKMLGLIEKIINSGQAYSYAIDIDDYLVPVEEKYIICNGKYEGKKFTFFKKKSTKSRIELNEKIIEDSKRIMNNSYNRTASIIEQMFEQLFDQVGYIVKEMVFYEFAIKLYDILGERNIDICFPEVVENKMEFINAKDIYLVSRYAVEGYNGNIYGNSISLDNSKNCLIIGQNNTGKTVFLRSIGMLQIFSQNGLYVPCDKAYFMIKSQLVSIFSGEEKDTNVGGRFEKEVIDIKDVIDKVDSNSLVIINEIFQSTFALDGMNALLDVLSYFTYINVKWITVTHLISKTENLKDLDNKVVKYETTGKENNYKIKEV